MEGAVSYTDRTPVAGGTKFNIGSVSKLVTAALVVKLCEEAALTLDDPVQRFIPEMRHPQVTLLHLLTHASGIRAVMLPWPKLGGIRPYLEGLYAHMEWDALPGEQFGYYSPGYTILMDVLERVSGMELEPLAQSLLFKPLGMDNTTYGMSTLQAGEYVVPIHADRQTTAVEYDELAVTGDSGIHSTATDLVKFGAMILDRGMAGMQRIFTEAAIDLMLRESTGGRYARTPLGMQKTEHDIHRCFSDLNSPQTVGHPGFSGCHMWIDPVYDTAGVIISNSIHMHGDWRNYRLLATHSMKLALGM
jgi:CubicO group peptidase (beta-lactamase class C family)